MALEKLKERMHALGMRPVLTPDGRLEGQATFRNLVNAFTRAPILAANVRNFGEDAVVCSSPAHMTHLPAIKVFALRDAAAFESEVHVFYQRRLEKLQEANTFLTSLKLPATLDEPGFRVVSEIWVGNEVVRFTLRQGAVVQVLAVAGVSLDGKVDPRNRRVDASKVRTGATLSALLEPLLARVGAALAGGGKPAEAARREAAPQAVAKPRAQSDRFDHEFTGVLAQDPLDQDTFGGFARPQESAVFDPDVGAPQAAVAADDVALIALVCAACGSFYLVEENPSDARLLDTCPRCLGIKS